MAGRPKFRNQRFQMIANKATGLQPQYDDLAQDLKPRP